MAHPARTGMTGAWTAKIKVSAVTMAQDHASRCFLATSISVVIVFILSCTGYAGGICSTNESGKGREGGNDSPGRSQGSPTEFPEEPGTSDAIVFALALLL